MHSYVSLQGDISQYSAVNPYQHLFFDLDHTLWDFEANSNAVLSLLYDEYQLQIRAGFTKEQFIMVYKRINGAMWDAFHRGEISREELRYSRFGKTFRQLDFTSAELEEQFPIRYLELLPSQKRVFPDAFRVLAYLKSKYKLHLITNGFAIVQRTKLSESGLGTYFDVIVISELTGFKKPDREIFEYALDHAQATAGTSLMIGDDPLADIRGALDFGMKAVFFNPHKDKLVPEGAIEINELKQLMDLL